MELTPITIIPDSYNPQEQVISWADILPNFTLPSGKIFIQAKGGFLTKDKIFAKGVTHLASNDQGGLSSLELQTLRAEKKSYHYVPITPELFGIGATGPNNWVGSYPDSYNELYWPNGLPTYEQAFSYGQNCNIDHALIIGETMENNHYTNPTGEHWRGYYEAKAARLQAKFGNDWKMCHDYLFSDMAPAFIYSTENELKAFSRNQTTVPKWNWYRNNGALNRCNLTTTPVYLGGPDRDKHTLYGLAYSGSWNKRAGMFHVSVPTPLHEWRPNNLHGITMPEGTLFKFDKFPVSAALNLGIAIVSLAFCDGVAPWGHFSKVPTENKTWSTYWTEQFSDGSFWVANGETTQRDWRTWPHLVPAEGYTQGVYSGSEDMWQFGAYAYARTLGQTIGGARSWCQYKVGTGDWYTPVNQYEDDIIYSGKNLKAIFIKEVLGNKMSYLFINPAGTNTKETVLFTGPNGQQYSFETVGDMPKMGLINL